MSPALVIVLIILRSFLELWLSKPAALGIASVVLMLAVYKFIPNRQVRFGRWVIFSMLLTAYIVVTIYGAPKLLCPRLGAVWTWGLLIAGFFLSLRWASLFVHRRIEGSLWPWLVLSAAAGSSAAFFAYINPEGFCR